MGKDERAISVSGYVRRELVKYTHRAFGKTVTYTRQSRNHLLDQVESFRVGDRDSGPRGRPSRYLLLWRRPGSWRWQRLLIAPVARRHRREHRDLNPLSSIDVISLYRQADADAVGDLGDLSALFSSVLPAESTNEFSNRWGA
jgi:hypothetical protein